MNSTEFQAKLRQAIDLRAQAEAIEAEIIAEALRIAEIADAVPEPPYRESEPFLQIAGDYLCWCTRVNRWGEGGAYKNHEPEWFDATPEQLDEYRAAVKAERKQERDERKAERIRKAEEKLARLRGEV